MAKFKLILLFVVTALFASEAFSMSEKGHRSDMNATFEYFQKVNPNVEELYTFISSGIIDDMKGERFLKSLPVAPDGKKIDHRSLFSLGF